MSEIIQRGLFDSMEDTSSVNGAAIKEIRGLVYVPELLSSAAQTQLLQEIDARQWMTDLRRRVQHYGYRYDYRSRSVDRSMRLGDLPSWAVTVAELLQGRGLFDRVPDQVIVNEYEPGQGIS